MKSVQISEQFTEYYKAKGFHLLARAPMLDPSIPMSFVMSAGLVQIETSLARSPDLSGNQFALTQNCFRHFDLEAVGTDSTHLSFFEMPGAFTMGVSNRAETIQNMWCLATSVLGIDPGQIWVTYFRGGNILENELVGDQITCDLWLDLGVPPHRVIGLQASNYWIQGRGIKNMSMPRKCGPNTELFFDRGRERACGPHCAPGCGCDRFVEFANSLFINFEMGKQNKLIPIADPFAETVIGTERVAMLLQNVPSVFEIEGYAPIFDAIRHATSNADLPYEMRKPSECVIADHIRALYHLIADGAPPPGKNGRERIIKLLIRRIMTHQKILGIDVPDLIPRLLNSLTPVEAIHSHEETAKRVIEYFAMEGSRFTQTIHRGQHFLTRLIDENHGQTLSGSQIAYLEKVQGLPQSLVAVLLWRRGLPFLESEYKQAIKLWRQTALN